MRGILFCGVLLALGSVAAEAAAVATLAENGVPVTMIDVQRTPQYTEVRLQTRSAIRQVCWTASGSQSPYLIAEGQHYTFLGGDEIASCPLSRDYDANAVMVLRFQPLPASVGEMSLVEGVGGEAQMINPNADPTTHYWNFLRVKLAQ